MKTFAFAALCAILSQCHARDSALSRPKRTLRMLESLFGSMRDTFAPLTAPALPAAQPPSEVILATKYPIGVKYALYPTVRMHIRPVQQHVIYMQSIPAPLMRAVRPPLNAGAVEILRPVAPPLVRLPKTQTTTTIHYEIIPLPVPVRAELPSAPNFSSAPSPSLPPPPPPPPTLSSYSYDETDDPSAPWSLDELPPPVPTSAPLNPLDEPNVPWNLHALPPPVATKQPRGNEAFGWPLGSSGHTYGGGGGGGGGGGDSGYTLPALFDNKLLIPAQNVGSYSSRQRTRFRPSQLQSEISVQPSVELAAYSQTQTLAQQPAEYVNRLRNLNSPRPQVFPNRNHRLRREAPPTYAVRSTSSVPKPVQARIPPSAFTSRRSDSQAGYGTSLGSSERPATRSETGAVARTPHATAPQPAPTIGHDIRLSPSDGPQSYVLITPRPVQYGRRAHADAAKAETRPTVDSAPTPWTPSGSSGLRLRGSSLDDQRRPSPNSQLSAFLDRAAARLRFPPTGSLVKAPRHPHHRLSPFSPSDASPSPSPSPLPSLSVDDLFDDRPTVSPSAGRSAAAADQFWRSDYDNVEYFEPIIIDIGGGDSAEFAGGSVAKVRQSVAYSQPKKSVRREPLRLPGKLHETVDRLSEALMHPPIFDAEAEANEPHALLLLVADRAS